MPCFPRVPLLLLPLFAALAILPALQSARAQKTPSPDVVALMLSDIHFDPFLDPGKVPQLAATPASGWRAILDAPASADRLTRLTTLQEACHTRGTDTSQALFLASLKQIHISSELNQFALLSGDLLAHGFDCKFKNLLPQADEAAFRAFTVKTMEYVLLELRAALPGVPVYPVLGNNDSGCGDYQIDPNSPFLAESAPSFVADVPASQRAAAQADFAAFGDYSVTLPAAFHNLRLIAIDNLFESKRHAGCNAKPNPQAATQQLAWLTAQLKAARAHGEKLWLVGHIPPGIDPYSTAIHFRNICAGQPPDMFLSSNDFEKTIAPFADVVQLVVLGHTHMDEMRLIPSTGPLPIAAKLIPSISPINGNMPSYLSARINPATGTLVDYAIVASSDLKGSSWATKYVFRTALRQTAYNAENLSKLIAGFEADKAATAAPSQTYIHNYYFKGGALLMSLFWPQYSCSLGHLDTESYRNCVCPAAQ